MLPVSGRKPSPEGIILQDAGQKIRQPLLIVPINHQIAVFRRQIGLDVTGIDTGHRQGGRHRLDQRIRHLFSIGGDGKHIHQRIDLLWLFDVTGKDHPIGNAEALSLCLQPRPLDAVARDQQPDRARAAQQGKNSQQPLQVFLRPQRRQRSDNHLAGSPLETGGRCWIALSAKQSAIDAIGDMTDFCRVEPPDIAGDPHQRKGGKDEGANTAQCQTPQSHASGDLAVGFFRPKTAFQMDMRRDREKAIHQGPFDRPPIVGQQKIGREI